MTDSRSSAGCVVDNYLGPSSTCTDRIARIFTTIAAFSLTSSLSSAIAASASGIYLLDRGLEAECSTAALSTFSIVTSVVGTISFISAIGISYRLCGNYDVYSSSVSSISPPPTTPSIAVVPNGINSSPSPLYNISSNILPQRSSTDSGFLSSHGVVPILSKSKPINCVEFLEFLETSL
ncbi:hypothetical protein [Candidatus Mesenet endosymbiont of Phosphuga atrata]|uniref:hypothetical protein n=1 Tax=Candidatus Mesenet endosymbiont of Phosphuga atrata TaxID=3066221 RepID=UPI0030D4B18B